MLTFLNIGLLTVQGMIFVAGGCLAFQSGTRGIGVVLASAGAVGVALAVASAVRAWRFQAESLVLGRVGHELRTPLAVMTGWLDQFRQSTPPGPDPEILDRQIRRMRVMVEGTLQGARRLGRTPPAPAPCLRRKGTGLPLTRVIADLAGLWPGPDAVFPDLPAGGIALPRLLWDLSDLDGLAQVPGDDRFHHILANILQNAFCHGIPRVRPLVRPWSVTVKMSLAEGSRLEVTVMDEGPGVRIHPLTGIPRSLDPETRRGPGTGLGFYLVRELVASAGGTLSIGPRTDLHRFRRGTMVRIVFPIEELE